MNISKEEIDHRLRDEGMKLLEGAFKQSELAFSQLDDMELPDLP